MKSDNETKMISRNRVLAESKLMLFFILPLDLVLFFWFNYAINTVANLGKILKNIENAGDYMGIENVLPRLSQYTDTPIIAYLSWLIVLLVLDSIVIHQIRIMLDEDEMKHVKDGSQWTTWEKAARKHEAIPLKKKFYEVQIGGIGHNQKPCIDNNKFNTSLYENTSLGMGKGKTPVYPTIDAYEEGRTMVISDPKSDLYKSSGTTEGRVEQEQ